MQNHLLPFCERLVLTELRLKIAQAPLPEQMYFIRTLATLQSEKDQALEAFNRLVFEVKEESQLNWIIQTYQKKIVSLSDHLAADMTNEDILEAFRRDDQEPTWPNLSKSILRTLLGLLNSMETNFTKYLELDGRIPVAYLVIARFKFDKRLSTLSSALSAAGISEQLQKFIRQPFAEFLCEDDVHFITYQRLGYLNALMAELSNVVPDSPDAESMDAKIQVTLRELNYNHPDFYNFCILNIKTDVEALPPKEGLERLIWMLKEVNQLQHKHGMVYNPLNESLKQQLQMWLTEEINYVKAVGEIPNTDTTAGGRWKDFKVETQFSVAQMAYCIRLLCDTGIFTNPNKSELLDFFSEFFASVKQSKISSHSLRKNFYNDDASAAAGVREILITLLNQSRKGLTSWMIGVASFCEFIFHVVYVNQ